MKRKTDRRTGYCNCDETKDEFGGCVPNAKWTRCIACGFRIKKTDTLNKEKFMVDNKELIRKTLKDLYRHGHADGQELKEPLNFKKADLAFIQIQELFFDAVMKAKKSGYDEGKLTNLKTFLDEKEMEKIIDKWIRFIGDTFLTPENDESHYDLVKIHKLKLIKELSHFSKPVIKYPEKKETIKYDRERHQYDTGVLNGKVIGYNQAIDDMKRLNGEGI